MSLFEYKYLRINRDIYKDYRVFDLYIIKFSFLLSYLIIKGLVFNSYSF
jgi:hypothetical protein